MEMCEVYLDFETLKKTYNLPSDALLKNINVNNEKGTMFISFYTNEEDAQEWKK